MVPPALTGVLVSLAADVPIKAPVVLNPVPVKTALAVLGIEVTPPVVVVVLVAVVVTAGITLVPNLPTMGVVALEPLLE